MSNANATNYFGSYAQAGFVVANTLSLDTISIYIYTLIIDDNRSCVVGVVACIVYAVYYIFFILSVFNCYNI